MANTSSPTLLGNTLPFNLPFGTPLSGSWSQVSISNNFAVALDSDGLLYAWGLNTSSQVGDGTTLNKSTPVQISTSSFSLVNAGWDHSGAIDVNDNLYVWGNSSSILAPTVNYSWKKISYGFTHALAIRDDDTLWAWGQNTAGQLGDSSSINKSSPVQIGTGSWIEVSAGVSHSLAINSDNMLFAWGLNSRGQIGDSSTINKSGPVQISSDSWIAVSAGGSFSVAVKLDNTLYIWGNNANYQLGDLTTINRSFPAQLGTDSWSLISAGISHTAAITTTGLLYVWGASSTLPDPSPTTIYSWTNIGLGTSVTGAIRSDGKLYVWGENTSGQLGQIIDLYRRSSPVAIASSNYTQILSSSFTQVGYGAAHGVALTTDGQIYTWGLGTSGQLGINTATNRSSPVPVPVTGTSYYQQVAAGYYATYAITSSSTSPAYALYGWGAGAAGELAQITNAANRSNPVLIASGTSFSKVSAGNGFAAGLTTDGQLYTWGYGTSGQLGELSLITKSSPVQVSGSWIDVGAGAQHVIAVRSDNTLWVWGNSSSIGLVVEPNFWTNVSMGLSNAVAITSGGSLYTWGLNSSGQLGDNTIVSKSSPTQVNLSSYILASTNGITTYAIANDNSLWGWGLNSSGQIGNNSTINRSSPAQIVSSLSSYTQIAAGFDHVLAVASDNNLYSWGRNTVGQLGTTDVMPAGDTINRSTPVIVNVFSPLEISAGNSFSTSIDATGALYAWGLNTSGQLGNKSIINRSTPEQIGTSNWTKVSSGFDHNLAIRSDGTLWTWGNATAVNLVVEPESWSQISYGTDHAIAIRNDGALFGWGKNNVGQLGIGTILNKSSPTMVTSLNFISWSVVSAGDSFSVGLAGGLVYTWGLNSSGQLGDLSTINKSNPTLVNAPPTRLLTLQNTTLIDNSNYNATITPGTVSSRYPYPAYNIGSYAGYATAFNALQFSTVTRGTAGNAGANSTTNGIDGMIWLNFPYSYGVTNSSATILSSISPAISGKTSWTLNDGAITLNSYGTTTFTCDSDVTVPIVVWGAGGGTTTNTVSNGGNGGAGGLTYAFVNLVAGTSYRAIVGQGGISASVASQVAAGGGGGSGIEISNTSNPIIVAGGGGGGGASNNGGFGYNAGGGGGTDGQRNTVIIYNGYGGSQAAAGAGAIGSNSNNGENGLNRNGGRGARVGGVGGGSAGGTGFGNGGEGGSGSSGAAGGGGGGYYGGGGGGYGDTLGPGGSGGGGSGYLNTSFVSNSITIQSNLYTVATVASSFDGYAIVPYNNGFDIPAATNWTFECYIYLTALPTNPNQYVIAGRNWNYGTSGPTWGFNILSTGVLQWSYASTGVATNVLAQTSTGVITTGSWIHLAFVKNTSNLASIYVNGTLSTSRTDANAMTNSSGDLYIGKASNLSSASQFNGHISDIRIVYGTAVYTGNFTVPTRTLASFQSSDTNISAITAGTDFEFISAGLNHVIGYDTSKTAYAWGLNNAGQLGINLTTNRSSPTTLASPWNTSSFVAVSAGSSFTTAIDSTGTLWTWGLNTSGQLGQTVADLISRSSPIQIGYENYFSWIKVSSGSTHSLGITTDNTLYVWGQSTAVVLPVTVFSWSQIATGIQSSHNAAIRSDGMLFVWGLNSSGQLGDNTVVSKSSPVQIGKTIWSSVALGSNFTLAKTASGTLYAWGLNSSGQLGDGTTTGRTSPVLVSTSSYTQISAGSDHAFALLSDGTTVVWGLNNAGQLGIGLTTNRSVPVALAAPYSFSQISAGASFTTAIDLDGNLYAWGLNNSYQLGDGYSAFINRSTPTLVNLPTALSFSSVNSGTDHTLALDINNKLWTWGNPLAVGVNVNSWVQVSQGSGHALALRSDGRMFAWGSNGSGELGQGHAANRSYPVPVGASSWIAVSAGYGFSTGVKGDGTLWTWGANNAGQLGDGTTVNKNSPIQVSSAVSIGSTLWTHVTAGASFVAAVNDGSLYTWGLNTSGQLGIGLTTNRSSPVQIGSLSNYSQVAAGLDFLTVTDQSGKMFATGANTLRQLGDNTIINQSSPVQIGLGNSWTKVSSGRYHSLAINYQNKLYIWGDQNSVNLVSNVQSWTSVSLGLGGHGLAITNDGYLYTWGTNNAGQLGDGTTLTKSSPVLVGTSTNWSKVSAGASHSLALDNNNNLWVWGLNSAGQLGNITLINRSNPTQISWTVNDSSVYNNPSLITSTLTYTTSVIPFDGAVSVQLSSADSITTYAQGSLSFGVGDFTIEVWVYPTSVSSIRGGIIDARTSAAAQYYIFALHTVSSAYRLAFYIPSTWYFGTTVISLNTWTHVAVTRESGTLKLWINGTLDYSIAITSTTAINANTITQLIGSSRDGATGTLVGYISNLRVVRNLAVYTGTFTPPTSPLTLTQSAGTNISAITGNETSLLTLTTLANSIFTPTYTEIAAGSSHSAAINNLGKLFVWGSAVGGALGDGTTLNKSSPVQLGVSSWSLVSAGDSFTTAITSTGKLYAWGLNSLNQLGNGTTITQSSPVQIGNDRSLSFSVVSAGLNHVAAIDSNSSLWTWGNPNAILLSQYAYSWQKISAGNQHTVAIRSDGVLYAWGLNNAGQLGDISASNKSSPVVVASDKIWNTVSAGDSHTLGITSDGNIYAWGLNTSGQLGNRTASNRSSPTIVSTFEFADVSNSPNTITQSGSLTYDTVNVPFANAISMNFLGNNALQFLRPAALTPLSFGTGDFTVEAWINVSSYATSSAVMGIFDSRVSATAVPWLLDLRLVGLNYYLEFYTGTQYTGKLPIPFNQWVHVAATRESSTIKLWVNGVLDYYWPNITTSLNITSTLQYIGRLVDATNYGFNGNISNLRVVKGIAVYTGTFTVPTSPLTATQSAGTNISAITGDETSLLILTTTASITGNKSFSSVSAGAIHSLAISTDSILYAWGSHAGGALGDGTTVGSKSSPIQIGNNSWSIISAGTSYSLGVDADGKLYSWGLNTLNQLGDGTSINKSSPVLIGGDPASFSQLNSSFVSISAGQNHALAIMDNYSLWTWGNTSAILLTRLQANSWAKISAGASHTLAIRDDGMLFTWGLGTSGQLGDGTAVSKSSPVVIGNYSWNSVGAGQLHSFAVRSDGMLFAWGLGTSGQLGLVTSSVSRSSPVQIGTDSWTMAVGGNLHSLGINALGQLYTWGASAGGQTGQGNTTTLLSPVQLGTDSWSLVTAGSSYSVAIRNDYTMWAWGINTAYQLGDSTSITKSSPVQIGSGNSWRLASAEWEHTAALTSSDKLYVWGAATSVLLYTQPQSWTQIAVGGALTDSVVAIRTDGTLWSWGNNSTGQLGIGLTTNRSSPVLIDSGNWSQIAAGNGFALAIRSDGMLFTWGDGSVGQGDGTTINRSLPLQLGNDSWKQIGTTAYSSSAFAIKGDDTLWAWGDNTYGALGLGDTISRSSPVQVGTSTWKTVLSGYRNTLGIFNDDTLYTWGYNAQGQLGDGTTLNKSSPVQLGSDTYIKIAAMANTSAAIRSDYTLWLWGLNNAGYIGDGTIINRSSPVQVSGGGSWTQIKLISSSNYSALGLKINGTLWAWGKNNEGQLGQGTTATNRSIPVQIGTSSWTSVESGIVATIDGLAYMWGRNTWGNLGDGTTISKSSPVLLGSTNINVTTPYIVPTQVGGLEYTTVNTGASYTVAIRKDTSQAWAWGLNTSGQLGDNSTITKSSPVLVGGAGFLGNVSYVIVGGAHNFAWTTGSNFYTWGLNNVGQQGIYATINRSSPVITVLTGLETQLAVPKLVSNSEFWYEVAAGQSFSLARTLADTYAWGVNNLGQLGNGTTTNRSSPTLAASFSGAFMADIAAGASHAAAVDFFGNVFTWGSSVSGQTGTITTINRSNPVSLESSTALNTSVPIPYSVSVFNNWSNVAAGTSFTAATDTFGYMYAWGLNSSGQLGINTAINRSSPTQVDQGTMGTTTIIAAGGSTIAAISSDNLLYAWGLGTTGQTGTLINVNRSSPTILSPISVASTNWPIPTLYDEQNDYLAVSAGASYSLAIRSDGSLYTWGVNTYGSLGDNSTITKSSMVLIGATSDSGSWIAIASSVDNTSNSMKSLAITSNNSLFSWGANPLGDNTTITRSSPVQIPVSNADFGAAIISKLPMFMNTSFSQVSAGTSHSLARKSNDNTVFAWGINNVGQFLDSTITSASVPVIVGQSPIVTDASQVALTVTTPTGQPKSTYSSPFGNDPYDVSIYGGSLYFDGASRGLIAADPTMNIFDNANGCSMEIWFKPVNVAVNQMILTQDAGGASTQQTFQLYITSTKYLAFLYFTTSTRASARTITSSVTVNLNSWNHALVTSTSSTSSTIRLFLNGNLVGFEKPVTPYTAVNRATGIGSFNGSVLSPFNGLLTNLRMVSGSIPTDYQTEVLGGLLDQSNFSASVQNFNTDFTLTSPIPFAGAGSAIFDGSTSYLNVGKTGDNFNFSSGDFTVECWVNVTSSPGSSQSDVFLGYGSYGNEDMFRIATYQNDFLFRWSPAGVISGGNNFVNPEPHSLNTWYHTAIVRISGTVTCYVNGVSLGSVSHTVSYNTDWGVRIGALNGVGSATNAPGYYFNGYVSNVRVVKGVGVYTGNFTVPSSPLAKTQSAGTNISAITGDQTSLLSLNNTAGTTESTYVSNVITVPTSPLTETSQGATSGDVVYLGLRNIPTYAANNISAQHSTTSMISNSDNTLINGGFNNVGQLGNGVKLNRSTPVILGNDFSGINTGTEFPVAVMPGTSFIQIAAASSFSGAVSSDFNLFTWGVNTNGQLGDNSAQTKSSPVQIAVSANVISGGTTNMAYIDKFTHKLYAWGLNNNTQLGVFNTVYRSTPTLVGDNQALNSFTNSPVQVRVGYSNFTQIAAGSSYSVAVDSDSNVWAWGLNNVGQLGLTDTINRSFVTQIASGISISNVTAGTATILTDTTNRIYAFGYGLSGSIGTQQAINQSAPVMIGSSNHINTGTLTPVQVQFQLPSSWVAATAGYSHSLAINSLGEVYAFGRGIEGQLGNNSIINRSAPVLVGNSFSLISAGDYHSSAIGVDNLLYTWGLNNVGQLGDNTITVNSKPTLIGGQINTMTASPVQVTGSWNSVNVGSSHTLAIDSSNLLYSWGLNNYGQLGDNSTITKSSIVQVTAVGTQFVDTSVSELSLYPTGPGALMTLVSPFAGGAYDPAIYGASGSFNGTDYVITQGNFNNFNYYNLEFTVEAWIYTNTLIGVRNIIDSWYTPFQFLLRTNGSLLEVYLSLTSGATSITVNYTLPATGTWYHVAAVRRYDSQRTIPSLVLELYVDGISRGNPVYNDTNLPAVFDWYYRIGVSWDGYISNVRIVKGTAVYTSNFTPPVLPLSNIAGTVLLTCQEWNTTNTFTSVSAGSSFSIAKLTNGRIYGWGLNNFNQIGNYAAQWRSVPSLINSGSWSQIAAGQSTGFGIKDNLLYGWGQNNLGQLGDNTVTNKAFPNIVQGINLATRSPALVGSNFQTVSAGTSTTSAISNNSLFVWGLGTTGQIGIMSAVTRSRLTQIVGFGSWNKVFVGNSTLFAINTSNKLYAWGLGTNGQTAGYMTALTTSSPNTIGNNYLGVVNQSSPALLDSGSWIAITAGNLWSAAIRSDGALFTWGNRTDGTLGDGLTIARSMMMQIGTRSYTQVAGQQSHGAALSTTGELYTWGLNSAGQLGITSVSPGGDVIQRSSITLVGSNYSQISAGISYTAAIRTNGQLFAWGLGTSGELGYGTAASRSSPVAVAGNFSWTSLNAGYQTAGAITTRGELYNWGAAQTYQLASIWYNGVNRSLPTQVGNIWATLASQTRVPFKVDDSSWIGIDSGYYNSIGITSNNRLYTWGYNSVGRLGINSTINRSNPTSVGNYTYLSNTVSLGAFNVAVIGKGTFGDPTGGY